MCGQFREVLLFYKLAITTAMFQNYHVSSSVALFSRCGIKTCRKCRLFEYYTRQKQLCIWDEDYSTKILQSVPKEEEKISEVDKEQEEMKMNDVQPNEDAVKQQDL